MAENFLTGFSCVSCGTLVGRDEGRCICPRCRGNLDACYDYSAVAACLADNPLAENFETGIWRYAPFFPNSLDKNPCSFPIGMTPLIKADRLDATIGLPDLWLKNDTLNPSGSFKDRASMMVLARCREENLPVVAGASTGNAGTSMACLAASAGIRAIIFVPHTAPRAKIAQLVVYGARVIPVKGSYTQAFELCETVCEKMGWFNRNTGTNPFTREGKKTVSYEIWEQLGHTLPDAVAVSAGDGNIISGVYKGFLDLHRVGLISKIPKIIGVQSEKSNAIARAFHGNGEIVRVKADSIADSICADYPADGRAALNAAAASKGTFVTVPDEKILESLSLLARTQGVFAEPSGAAALAGVKKLVRDGWLKKDAKVAVIVTGSGLKDIDAVFRVAQMPEPVNPDPALILSMLDSRAGIS